MSVAVTSITASVAGQDVFSGASIFAPQAGQLILSGDEKPVLQLQHSLIIFPPHHTHSFWFSSVEEPHPEQYRYSLAIFISFTFVVSSKPLELLLLFELLQFFRICRDLRYLRFGRFHYLRNSRAAFATIHRFPALRVFLQAFVKPGIAIGKFSFLAGFIHLFAARSTGVLLLRLGRR
jgi:hypothetical protein